MSLETSLEIPLSELRWRCRRGMLELDVFLNRFIETGYRQLDAADKQLFYQLLEYQDQELVEILQGLVSALDSNHQRMASVIRQHARLPS